MTRSDYVLVWIPKEKEYATDVVAYCSLCRATKVLGKYCPTAISRCTKRKDDRAAFDNTKHIIIATKDSCNGKYHSCPQDCSVCAITNTYENVKVL